MALQQSPENHDSISRKRKSLISLEEKIEKKKKYDEEEEEKLVEDEILNIEDVITNWNFDLIFENWISMAGASENRKTEILVTNSDTVFKNFRNSTQKEWLSLLLGVTESEIYDEI
ncbi:hypothetical protein RDI58_000255 [Solanum bulbocastanum]|uniref:Uncharacterized protein n=1 Tax=Solanum bulbocastanum TaxID=147425 RepID=A0AAN8U9T6_SOLBU